MRPSPFATSKHSSAAGMADHDVLIAGGGPVGCALALALRGVCSVAVLEARPEGSASSAARPIALSHGSRLILERLGAWEALQPATPITRIHISQRGGFGQAELDCEEAQLPALGYVVDYNRLTQILSQLAAGSCDYVGGASVLTLGAGPDAARVTFQAGAASRQFSARLVALADGGMVARIARVRTREYRQAALTSEITSARPHRNVAYERFTSEGPLALLPSGERMALVWSTHPSHAQELCTMPEREFLQQLQRAFGQRLGALEAAGPRVSHPLALRVTGPLPISRAVVLGNAAQTLHPVAGQGFNLNLPLPAGTDFARWRAALKTALDRVRDYKPDALVVALGVDTFEGDPISCFKLKSEDYIQLGRDLSVTRLPVVFTLEGGYAVAAMGVNVVNVLEGFLAS